MLGKPVKRVRGTQRMFPAVAEFDEARLRETLSFRYLGKLSRPELGTDLTALLQELPGRTAMCRLSACASTSRWACPTIMRTGRPR